MIPANEYNHFDATWDDYDFMEESQADDLDADDMSYLTMRRWTKKTSSLMKRTGPMSLKGKKNTARLKKTRVKRIRMKTLTPIMMRQSGREWLIRIRIKTKIRIMTTCRTTIRTMISQTTNGAVENDQHHGDDQNHDNVQSDDTEDNSSADEQDDDSSSDDDNTPHRNL